MTPRSFFFVYWRHNKQNVISWHLTLFYSTYQSRKSEIRNFTPSNIWREQKFCNDWNTWISNFLRLSDMQAWSTCNLNIYAYQAILRLQLELIVFLYGLVASKTSAYLNFSISIWSWFLIWFDVHSCYVCCADVSSGIAQIIANAPRHSRSSRTLIDRRRIWTGRKPLAESLSCSSRGKAAMMMVWLPGQHPGSSRTSVPMGYIYKSTGIPLWKYGCVNHKNDYLKAESKISFDHSACSSFIELSWRCRTWRMAWRGGRFLQGLYYVRACMWIL